MSGKFPKLSWLLWSGKKRDAKLQNKSSLNSSAKLNELELDLLKGPAVGVGNLGFNSRRVRRNGRNLEQGKIDKEHDSVVVPSDGGGSSSDSESDGSDWSIGWSEPHAPGFLSEDEIDSGFGVLVRCYGRTYAGKTDINKINLGCISHDPDVYEAEKPIVGGEPSKRLKIPDGPVSEQRLCSISENNPRLHRLKGKTTCADDEVICGESVTNDNERLQSPLITMMRLWDSANKLGFIL